MKLGFIGTGLMGRPMAERLLGAGHRLTVYNRTRSKAAPLADRGAALADSPAAVFAASEATVLMLTGGPAVHDVLGGDGATPDLSGRTVIQMSTIAPGESRAAEERVRTAGGEYVEAPVLGSTPQAAAGGLLVLAAGPEERIERWRGVLETLGKPTRIGDFGQGAAVKLALNQLIASLSAAYAYSLGLVERHGVEPERFMEILRGTVLYAPTVDRKLPRLLERNFENPNFPVKHLLKDVDLALGEGKTLGLGTDAVEGVRRVLDRSMEEGLGEADYSALYEVVNPRT
jgi:3-hydroxyisobutyrate dehydrogenase